MSKASELSILTWLPEPINLAVTARGKRLWFWAGSSLRSRMTPDRSIEPEVVALDVTMMVVSTSIPFLLEPGKLILSSRFSASVDTNSKSKSVDASINSLNSSLPPVLKSTY